MVQSERILKWRNSKETTMIIIDSQSVKTTFLAKERWYDWWKKITGIKRHIWVDILWLPHMIWITTANISDRDWAKEMFLHYTWEERFDKLETILADWWYTWENLNQRVNNCFNAKLQVVKRNELHKFKLLPKRRIVERTFSWLEHSRRLWKNCERFIFTSLTFLFLAFISLILKRY